jgi:SAM-dependent methyltransferase
MTQKISPEGLALLGCVKCGIAPLTNTDNAVVCGRCGWSAQVVDNVVNALGEGVDADFDSLYVTMQENNTTDVISKIMYSRQSALVESMMKPGLVVLDIGCGPSVPYKKTPGVFLVGLDPSFASVRRNDVLDLALCGSATALPLGNHSVDLIVCFYSIHHMVGDRIAETVTNVNNAFSEFARVLKPNGTLLVFEVCPWPFFGVVQKVLWPIARRFIGNAVNYYFWKKRDLGKVSEQHLAGYRHSVKTYHSSPWAVFPPIFTLQWLKLPRFLYPLSVTLLAWGSASIPLRPNRID